MSSVARLAQITAEQKQLGVQHLADTLAAARKLQDAALEATTFPDTALKGGIRTEMRQLAMSLSRHISALEKISCSS